MPVNETDRGIKQRDLRRRTVHRAICEIEAVLLDRDVDDLISNSKLDLGGTGDGDEPWGVVLRPRDAARHKKPDRDEARRNAFRNLCHLHFSP